jgi:pyridoxal phosphate enzyme (YggS family)
VADLSVDQLRTNLERVRAEIADAGRDPEEVEVLAAVKYVPLEQLEVLADAGVTVVGENRAQELRRKADAYPGAFTWDFIGALQSRKVRDLLPYVRYIHSVATDSALAQLGRHGNPDTEVLVEVNIAGEDGKSGIGPDELDGFIERCPVRVVGLMAMPPFTDDPEASRPHFRALRELATAHGLRHLSMGTSQDYLVAVQEGATIVRLGTVLYEPPAASPAR